MSSFQRQLPAFARVKQARVPNAYDRTALRLEVGKISHKKSLITIFGHKHEIKNFIKKFDIFHKKISTAFSILVYIWNKFVNFESKLH